MARTRTQAEGRARLFTTHCPGCQAELGEVHLHPRKAFAGPSRAFAVARNGLFVTYPLGEGPLDRVSCYHCGASLNFFPYRPGVPAPPAPRIPYDPGSRRMRLSEVLARLAGGVTAYLVVAAGPREEPVEFVADTSEVERYLTDAFDLDDLIAAEADGEDGSLYVGLDRTREPASTDAGRVALAAEVYHHAFDNTASFELGRTGSELAYLLGEIAAGGSVTLGRTSTLRQVLSLLGPDHGVWAYVSEPAEDDEDDEEDPDTAPHDDDPLDLVRRLPELLLPDCMLTGEEVAWLAAKLAGRRQVTAAADSNLGRGLARALARVEATHPLRRYVTVA